MRDRIYIASLIGIDPSFYEAARLDGASKWQEITKITLPSLVPTIITLLLLSIGRIFYSDFGLFYQVPVSYTHQMCIRDRKSAEAIVAKRNKFRSR